MSAPGKVGNALRFNPDDGARLVTTTLPELAAPWTAAFWVKREADPESSSLFSSLKYALKLEQWPAKQHRVGFTPFTRFDEPFRYVAPLGECRRPPPRRSLPPESSWTAHRAARCRSFRLDAGASFE